PGTTGSASQRSVLAELRIHTLLINVTIKSPLILFLSGINIKYSYQLMFIFKGVKWPYQKDEPLIESAEIFPAIIIC
ncbi:hypothetical protein, partial [Acidianus sp. RZ1]|uniref:hypothetical protein n=1 Tax=Acidianus sp. RZ1 TaxID=1540082 RepID=UPI001C1134C9